MALQRGTALACALVFSSRLAAADAHQVVVISPATLTQQAWPAGTRAVVAELSTSGFQVSEQTSKAQSLDELVEELPLAALATGAAGAVTVLREGRVGAAYVWTQYRPSVMRIDTHLAESAVAEGTVALRVVELFRNETLWFPVTPPAQPEPRTRPLPRSAPPARAALGLLWVGASAELSSDVSVLPFGLSVGLSLPAAKPFALDLTAAATLLSGRFDSSYGRVHLQTEAVSAHVLFDPWAERAFGAALGLGAGVRFVQASALGAPGFQGLDSRTSVASLSARARVQIRTRRVSLLLFLDPGLTLPAVSVRADNQEVARLGRPWVSLQAAVGWQL